VARSAHAWRGGARIGAAALVLLCVGAAPAAAAGSLAPLALPAVPGFGAPSDVPLSSAALADLAGASAAGLRQVTMPVLLRSFTRGSDRVAELLIRLASPADAADFGRGFAEGAVAHGARQQAMPHAVLWRGFATATSRADAAVIEHGSVVAVVFASDGALSQPRLQALVAQQWQRLGGDPGSSGTGERIGRVVGYAAIPLLLGLVIVRRFRRR
jgi:hypothetical protein